MPPYVIKIKQKVYEEFWTWKHSVHNVATRGQYSPCVLVEHIQKTQLVDW